MLRNYAAQWAGFSRYISELEYLVPNSSKETGGNLVALALMRPEIARQRVRDLLPALSALCNWLPMPSSTAQIGRIESMLNLSPSEDELIAQVRNLRDRIEDELKQHVFFHVAPSDVQLYSQPMLFGQAVNLVFPNAADDIEAAGKCLAFRQGTATVFHLMRVLEAGMRALAGLLKIPYAPSWESYITQITNKVNAKHKTKGIAWKRDQPLFIEILGDLKSIKIAWRNPTMHIHRKYTADEAAEIFRATKRFMERLSARLE